MQLKGYVDMHSHILPGVDDGSKNMEMTCKMLEMAYAQGVRTMFATPHFGSGKEKYDKDFLMEQYELVKEKAKNTGEEGIALFLGNELYYGHGTLESLETGKALTMNGSKYVLVEFDVEIRYNDLYSALQKLVLAGYRPILAHIERYMCLYKQYDKLYSLKKMGITLQVNTASVIPRLSSHAIFCRRVIEEGYIDILGSDTHSTEWRPPCMQDAIKVLKKKTPEKTLKRILESNPQKIYQNEFI